MAGSEKRNVMMREVGAQFARLGFGSGRPVVIAGPCSVESEEQIHTAAGGVKRAGATLLRGGAFKPRTSPRSFQGLGEIGLRFLADAGKAAGLPVVTEVMDTAQIDLVAQYADVLQVGSRNMQNFALLKQVGRAGKPVMLKRGLSATIDEWLGAAEYITDSGNDQVILCERGIRTFETQTRNTLDLSSAIIARSRSGLPVIVDPSHASGRRDLIGPLTAAALASGMDGVMIEVHPDPSSALSDAEQQLDIPTFHALMAELGLLPESALTSLQEARAQIDRADDQLLQLLAHRLRLAERAGELKLQQGAGAYQPAREQELLLRLAAQAEQPLTPAGIRAIWSAVLDMSRQVQLANHGD